MHEGSPSVMVHSMVLPGFHTVQQGDRRFFRQSLASITGDGPGNCDDSDLSPLPLALALGTIVSKVARILSLTFLHYTRISASFFSIAS